MTYRTACPNCASVFRLGEDQLAAARGWVQCGVCGAAFDARPSLLMQDGSPLPAPGEPALAEAAAAVTAVPVAEPVPVREPVPAEAPPEDAAAAGKPRGIVAREDAPDLPSIILIDPDIPVSDDFGPVPQIYPAPSTYPPLPAGPASRREPPASTDDAPAPAARIEYAAPAPGPASQAHERTRWPRRVPGWTWAVASVLLGLALLAQAAYFLRDTLATRLPQTRPAFEQACAVLGCTLSLPKDLALLRIVGSDLQTEATGRLRLTLTLGNRAGHVQAWPVLVLTLTDQRDRPLARRSFAPSEYLGDPRRIAAGIPARSEQALALPLTVNDLKPMGFGLELAY